MSNLNVYWYQDGKSYFNYHSSTFLGLHITEISFFFVLARLEALKSSIDSNLKLLRMDFDKDDQNNYHIEFVMSVSNLLAETYGIKPADRLRVFSF